MKATIAETLVKEGKEMRSVYCQSLIDLARVDKRIVVLDADLLSSIGMLPFAKAYPERTFNVGIQEANMIGVAAGLSATGKIPFAHSFAPFATRRCFDQIFLSCGYAKLNVRIVGSDPGVTAAFNGGTHMPFEDIGILRTVPGITILEPTDSVMLRNLVEQVADLYGVFYIRLIRKNATKVYQEGSSFEIGKAVQLREGSDLTIIATGIMVEEALKAADTLVEAGIFARVVNMFSIKPVDEETIIKAARETGAIVSAENHNIINGLGSAIAEVIAENALVPLERVGVQDQFGEVGSVNYLMGRFGLTAGHIVEKARKALGRKAEMQIQYKE
ncbi:Transketolase C-terminal/Pyruvate-ferredoxin oxidoreductase domain II [Acididesulfobacillus acetoxydans]|uniref:Transketolase C-terminal/Pyruvate-ferredoxin oxidoreductase domain II n=1 Tax=Acididesulfobacillus acetoxydans TaxID=1561005 RepID=A0A8S0VYH3_9FIRM|nr:transketolase family protein [Acididesulfobacillus acetoxydans]CAA7603013.1 Transketolase C-terminal/Pyruvate-ferredoxin oxidoreductase domain II [Acididesulfobacillus acetoxydans]CEJ08609.1 Transketolase-like protein 1 [Acididesulfobacillus acetoxydans]